MFTQIASTERQIPQNTCKADPNKVRRAAKLLRKIRLAKKAGRKGRGPVVPASIAARLSVPLPVPKPVSVPAQALHPKADVLRFEDSPFYYGYTRRTSAGESCCGTRS